jgi:hypothetical protein
MWRRLIVGVALLALSIPAAIAKDKGNKGRGNQGRQAGLTMLDDDIRWGRDGDLERGRGRRDRDTVFGRRDRDDDDRRRGRGRDDDRVAVCDPFFNRNGSKIKHRGMDRNGDGIISRREWRGNDVSFDRHDRNGDGILSGDEARPGAKRDRDRTRTIF